MYTLPYIFLEEIQTSKIMLLYFF